MHEIESSNRDLPLSVQSVQPAARFSFRRHVTWCIAAKLSSTRQWGWGCAAGRVVVSHWCTAAVHYSNKLRCAETTPSPRLMTTSLIVSLSASRSSSSLTSSPSLGHQGACHEVCQKSNLYPCFDPGAATPFAQSDQQVLAVFDVLVAVVVRELSPLPTNQ